MGWSGLQAGRPRGPSGQATWKAALKKPEDVGGGDGREGAEGGWGSDQDGHTAFSCLPVGPCVCVFTESRLGV